MEDYEDIVDYYEDILLKDDIFLSSLVGGFGPLDLEAGTGLCTREGNLQWVGPTYFTIKGSVIQAREY